MQLETNLPKEVVHAHENLSRVSSFDSSFQLYVLLVHLLLKVTMNKINNPIWFPVKDILQYLIE